MAYATQITISTGNKVSLNFQSQEVSVTLTYQLEREDTDVLVVVHEKTAELAEAHRTAWQTLRDAKVAAAKADGPKEANRPPDLQTVPMTDRAPEIWRVIDEPEAPPSVDQSATTGQLSALRLLLQQAGWSDEQRADYLRDCFSCNSVDELNAEQAKRWLLELQRGERETDQYRRLDKAHRNGKP